MIKNVDNAQKPGSAQGQILKRERCMDMYMDEYKRWLAADLEDADLKPELQKIDGDEEAIKDRFAVALKFGTAGRRGVLGAGTNRMNI